MTSLSPLAQATLERQGVVTPMNSNGAREVIQ